jgi:hypothetical protein
LLGDRVYATLDPETGKMASTTHPTKPPGKSGETTQ